MKGSRRHNLKKKLRRGKEQVALGVEILQRPDAKTLDDIFGLFWQTYEKSATNLRGSIASFLKSLLKSRRRILSSSGNRAQAKSSHSCSASIWASG